MRRGRKRVRPSEAYGPAPPDVGGITQETRVRFGTINFVAFTIAYVIHVSRGFGPCIRLPSKREQNGDHEDK